MTLLPSVGKTIPSRRACLSSLSAVKKHARKTLFFIESQGTLSLTAVWLTTI